MKRFKKIYILLGVLVVGCLATVLVMRHEEEKERIRNSDEIVLEVATDAVTALSWENEDGTLSFHKEKTWLYDEDAAFPVDGEKMDGMLEQFEAFGASFIIEGVDDFGQYGLDDPVCTIRMTADETQYEILLGDFSAMDSERYVSIGDGNVYLVANDPLEQFDAVFGDMIDHDDIPVFEFEQVNSIRFSGAQSYDVAYEEDSAATYCPEDVYFARLDGAYLPLDTGRVNSYLNKVSYLDPTDYVSYNVTEKELAEYGLDDPELTVMVDYTYTEEEDGEEKELSDTFILHISRDPEEKAKAEAEAAAADTAVATADEADADDAAEGTEVTEEITAYVRVGESQIAYRIIGTQYEGLMAATYDDLRHLELLTADFADVTGMDIVLEGATYTITSKEADEARSYSYLGEELDIADLESALMALTADGFTDETPTEKEEISLSILWYGGINYLGYEKAANGAMHLCSEELALELI